MKYHKIQLSIEDINQLIADIINVQNMLKRGPSKAEFLDVLSAFEEVVDEANRLLKLVKESATNDE